MLIRSIVETIVNERKLEYSETSYILDGDNRIVYCNPAWDSFALANDGPKALGALTYGSDVLDVCCDSLRPFYRDLYAISRVNQRRISLGYHCSTPKLFRAYEMSVDPYGEHILVTNHLLNESPHPGPALNLLPEHMREGIATLCANCRRTRNWRSDSWEWVPRLLSSEYHERLSHGICENCSEFYFGRDLLRGSSDYNQLSES